LSSGLTTQLWAPTLMFLAITADLPLKTFHPLYIWYGGLASPERLVF
jgi:hypothetical protein